jgi:hypothetical protein
MEVNKMAEPKMLTARELADKAGTSPAKLRKLLRTEFNRAGKTTVEGNRSEYRFNPNDPVIKQIVSRAKELMEQTSKEKIAEPDQANKEEGNCTQ